MKFNIVLTGKMSMNRNHETERYKNLGINVQRAITKATTYLVCGESPGWNKIEKAEKNGIIRIAEEDFYKMLEDEYPEYLV